MKLSYQVSKMMQVLPLNGGRRCTAKGEGRGKYAV